MVGSPVSRSPWNKTERLIGPLGNMLVLRTVMSGHLTFLELLKQEGWTVKIRLRYGHETITSFQNMVTLCKCTENRAQQGLLANK